MIGWNWRYEALSAIKVHEKGINADMELLRAWKKQKLENVIRAKIRNAPTLSSEAQLKARFAVP